MDGETTRQVFLILSCVIMGVGLSACCGFKVFVPPLILSILAKAGLVGLSGNFAWLGTWTAIAVLSIATCTETVAYFWPLVNNALDVIKTPAAAIVGTMVASAAMSTEISPVVRWTMSILAGGGTAAAISAGEAAIRAQLTAATAGVGGIIQNILETAVSTIVSFLAVLVPVLLGLFLLLVALAVLAWFLTRQHSASERQASRRRHEPHPQPNC